MTCLPPEQVLSLSGCFAFLLHKGFLQSQLAADFQLSYSVTEGHSKGIFIEPVSSRMEENWIPEPEGCGKCFGNYFGLSPY